MVEFLTSCTAGQRPSQRNWRAWTPSGGYLPSNNTLEHHGGFAALRDAARQQRAARGTHRAPNQPARPTFGTPEE